MFWSPFSIISPNITNINIINNPPESTREKWSHKNPRNNNNNNRPTNQLGPIVWLQMMGQERKIKVSMEPFRKTPLPNRQPSIYWKANILNIYPSESESKIKKINHNNNHHHRHHQCFSFIDNGY